MSRPEPRTAGWTGLALLAAGLLSTCKEPAPPPPLQGVRWSGCADVRIVDAEPTCFVQPGAALTFFIAGAEPGRLEVRQGPRALEAVAAETPAGARLTATPTTAVEPVVIRRTEPRAELSLRVAPLDLPEILAAPRAWLDDPARHEALAQKLDVLSRSEDPVLRAKARSVQARLLMRTGAPTRGVEIYRETIQTHRRLGLVRDEFMDRFALFFRLVMHELRLEEQHAVLTPLDDLAPLYPEGAAMRDYYAGVARLDGGAVQLSLDLEERAMRAFEALGHPMADDARFNIARVLRALGRFEELGALLEPADASRFEAQGCADGTSRLANLGFFGYVVASTLDQGGDRATPRARVERAIHRMERECAASPYRGQLYLTLATLLLMDGDLPAARAATRAAAREVSAGSHIELKVRSREGQVELQAGNHERALLLFRRLRSEAGPADDPEAQREAVLGQARALAAMSKPAEAIDVLEDAERLLDLQVRQLPLGLGRETFLASNDAIGALHVQLLLEQGQTEAAYQVVVRGHRRGLDALGAMGAVDRLPADIEQDWLRALREYREARRDAVEEWSGQPKPWTVEGPAQRKLVARRTEWSHALNQRLNAALRVLRHAPRARTPMASPRAKVGVLAIHPLPDNRWAAFLASAEGIRAVRGARQPGGRMSPAATAELLKGLFGPRLALERLEVLDNPTLQAFDLAQLEVSETRLIEDVDVLHVLDVGEPARAATARPRALVVSADPDGTLAKDELEARLVTKALGEAGFAVDQLGGDRATIASVSAALSDPAYEVFHFVGHGSALGTDGWQSGLLLGDGNRFTVADILLLGRVPKHVVLSACVSGKAGAGGVTAGVGLAQAFVVRGAQTVVGTVRFVDDDESYGFAQRFYASGGAEAPTTAFRAAVRASKASPQPFRLWQRR